MRPIRWPRVAVAAAALTMVAATSTPLGTSGPTTRAPGTCPTAPSPDADGAIGAWWRLDPLLDARGALAGHELSAGIPAQSALRLRLAAESFATGPFAGLVVYGSDDGRRSRLAMLDLSSGCSHPIATESVVVRRAVLDPSAGAIFEFRVDRRTRRDLGVWRRSLDGGRPVRRVLPPIDRDARFGATWTTELTWAEDGRLVVTSCGAHACRSRLLDTASGAVATIARPDLGEPLGVADGRYVAYLACRGLPCPIVAVDLDGRHRQVLAQAAGLATLVTDDDGHARLVHETVGAGLTVVDLSGTRSRTIANAAGRPIPSAPRAGSAVAVPPGWFATGSDGRVEPGGIRLIRARVGRTVPAAEVIR